MSSPKKSNKTASKASSVDKLDRRVKTKPGKKDEKKAKAKANDTRFKTAARSATASVKSSKAAQASANGAASAKTSVAAKTKASFAGSPVARTTSKANSASSKSSRSGGADPKSMNGKQLIAKAVGAASASQAKTSGKGKNPIVTNISKTSSAAKPVTVGKAKSASAAKATSSGKSGPAAKAAVKPAGKSANRPGPDAAPAVVAKTSPVSKTPPVSKASSGSKAAAASKTSGAKTSGAQTSGAQTSVESKGAPKPATVAAVAQTFVATPADSQPVAAQTPAALKASPKPTAAKVAPQKATAKTGIAKPASENAKAANDVAPAKVPPKTEAARAESATVASPQFKAPEAKAPETKAAPVIAANGVRINPPYRPAVAPAMAKPVTKPGVPHAGFKAGEFIVYPAHGVGLIVAIEEQEVAGFKLELFVINFVKDKMTLKVPMPKVLAGAIRKLSSPEAVKKALDTLTGRARIKRTMWSRRAQEYEAKINSGDLVTIAEVVRDLYRSDAQPEQSYSERQLYEAAVDRMAREVAAVQKLTEHESLKLIEQHLQRGPRRGAKSEAEAGAVEDVSEAAIDEAA